MSIIQIGVRMKKQRASLTRGQIALASLGLATFAGGVLLWYFGVAADLKFLGGHVSSAFFGDFAVAGGLWLIYKAVNKGMQ